MKGERTYTSRRTPKETRTWKAKLRISKSSPF